MLRMAKEMFSFRIDSGLRDVLAARAERENRSVSNMAEVLLSAALTERGVGEVALVRPQSTTEARVAPDAPRSVSPADVAATISGVTVGRPHMRKDKPALQCEARRLPCHVCGASL